MEVFIIAAVIGLGVGILSGLLGIGGGMIMVPVMRLGFGMTALQATGTSLFTMIFTSIAGTITHIRNRTCIVPLGLLAGTCGALTSPVGVRLANLSPAWLVMLATAGVIAYSASTMLRKGLALPKTKDLSAQNASAKSAAGAKVPEGVPEMPQLSRKQYIFGALAGLIAGLAGGFVGLGGGFLMVPVFITGVGISMKHASGTSLLAVAILASSGAVAQAVHGNLVVLVGLAMAAGSIPGAVIGANFVKKVPERTLRITFGVVLLITAAVLAINEIFFA